MVIPRELLETLSDISLALHRLGLNDAAGSVGAMELLSMEVKEGSERIAGGLHAIAESIRESK